MGRKYEEAHIEYLKNIYKGRTKKEIAALMNERFPERLFTPAAISSYMSHLHLHPGIRNYDTPHYTKKWREVGCERVRKDGYIYVKYAEPNVWKKKSDVVWYEHTGKWPEKGTQTIYLNQDRNDVRFENLYMMPMKGAFSWSRIKKTDSPDLNKLICLCIELQMAIVRRCLEIDKRKLKSTGESVLYKKVKYHVKTTGGFGAWQSSVSSDSDSRRGADE